MKLSDVKKLAEKASPGPWRSEVLYELASITSHHSLVVVESEDYSEECDFDFIAATDPDFIIKLVNDRENLLQALIEVKNFVTEDKLSTVLNAVHRSTELWEGE